MSQIQKIWDGTVSPDVETLTGDSGGAVGPNGSFNIDLLGGDGISTLGNPGANSITFSQTADAYTISTVQTTDATADVTLFTITLAEDEAITINATIAAAIDDYSGAIGGTVSGSARRPAAGAATLISSPNATIYDDIGATADFDITVSGNDVRVSVTGVAATTINWRAQLHYVLMNV